MEIKLVLKLAHKKTNPIWISVALWPSYDHHSLNKGGRHMVNVIQCAFPFSVFKNQHQCSEHSKQRSHVASLSHQTSDMSDFRFIHPQWIWICLSKFQLFFQKLQVLNTESSLSSHRVVKSETFFDVLYGKVCRHHIWPSEHWNARLPNLLQERNKC